MASYRVRIRTSSDGATRSYAIQRAEQVARDAGVRVSGQPIVRLRKKPIPLVGPRREFLVTFTQATRTPFGD
jgi:hypothetical protein